MKTHETFRGICYHVEAVAEAAGDGYRDYCDRRGIEFPCDDFALLRKVGREHIEMVREKYGRVVVMVGVEGEYTECLCEECLEEMLWSIKLRPGG